ncbi:DNA/RNA non-specific endonuclease, partial [Pseudomonas sp. 21C1]|uniref:DNA/RNA non-specific endonuclease n=1 Tax=Pseudomonas sp. 21C1 TaxID=1843690 RepID=UPI000A3E40E8
IPVIIGAAWLVDKGMTAYDAYQDIQALRSGETTLEQLAMEKGEDYIAQVIVGNVGKYGLKAVKIGGNWVANKISGAKGEVKLASVEVDVTKASKGTPEYKILNEPPPNSQVKLSNGTEFKTNSSGYVDELTFTPSLEKGTRDTRQTAVGKEEGLSTDVGGHVQGCQLGGTCDRFNLFPQDGNFNNSAFKRWEMGIKRALKSGDQVGPVTVRFSRTDPASARPDSLVIDYSVNGEKMRKSFRNEAGQ